MNHRFKKLERAPKMILNWISDVNRRLHQFQGKPDDFQNPITGALSPAESCVETFQTDFITQPLTPWAEYPTPPPSRCEILIPSVQSPQQAYCITPTEESQLPVCLDFLIDQPVVGPQFENVAEAKAFLLESLNEFYSEPDARVASEVPEIVNISSSSSSDCLEMSGDEIPAGAPQFATIYDAKEYILSAVREFYSRNESHSDCDTSGTWSAISEQTIVHRYDIPGCASNSGTERNFSNF